MMLMDSHVWIDVTWKSVPEKMKRDSWLGVSFFAVFIYMEQKRQKKKLRRTKPELFFLNLISNTKVLIPRKAKHLSI